jgi:hypothetical protein
MWLELSNLVIGAEADHVLAQASKALEPAHEPPFEDSALLQSTWRIVIIYSRNGIPGTVDWLRYF